MKEKVRVERVVEMERMMNEVFHTVSAMKRAYASLQEAHWPLGPRKDEVGGHSCSGRAEEGGSVEGQIQKEYQPHWWWQRRKSRGRGRGSGSGSGVATVREVVAPDEAVVEELMREVKLREVEVENLKEKLRTVALSSLKLTGANGKKGNSRSHHLKGKVGSAPQKSRKKQSING